MTPLTTLYKLKEIRGRQIILQAPSGGLRVVPADGLIVGNATSNSISISTALVVYTISVEDYQQIKTLITTSN
ncbi:MAG TPA: hypothetical protein PLN21_05475 [Gemmatales bacterium]|nr:hypothetical protein [Gemmatales bacterium]